MSVEAHLGEAAVELRAPRAVVPARELLEHHPARVVAVAGVLTAGIAEADDEQVERRGAFAPTPRQTHEWLPLVGAGLALGGLGCTLCGDLGLLALDGLLALGGRLLGLLDAGRHRERRDDGLGIVDEGDAV